MQILYIDADIAVADSFVAYAQYAGHVVRHATNAEQALELLSRSAPSVVVLELGLAGNSGLEFLYEFRSYADWQSIPVVLFCQSDVATYQKALQQLGIHKVLYKPFTSLQTLIAAAQDACT